MRRYRFETQGAAPAGRCNVAAGRRQQQFALPARHDGPAKPRLAADPIFDSKVMSHGFTSYMRDYDVVIEAPALRPDGSGSYIEGRHRCPQRP
jgi:hypothetical protein